MSVDGGEGGIYLNLVREGVILYKHAEQVLKHAVGMWRVDELITMLLILPRTATRAVGVRGDGAECVVLVTLPGIRQCLWGGRQQFEIYLVMSSYYSE